MTERTIQIIPAPYWFTPTYTYRGRFGAPRDAVDEEGNALMEIEFEGVPVSVEWRNRFAKPVYWLWQRWWRLKVIISRLFGRENDA